MPFPASLKALADRHAMTDFAELAEEAMRAHRWEAALGLTEHLPPETVLKLLAKIVRPRGAMRQLDDTMFDQPYSGFGLPSFLDAWVVGLLNAGVDLDTPLQGLIQRSDNKAVLWAGTVHAMAVLAGLPKTWEVLQASSPHLVDWEKLPIQVDGDATTLLHLAIMTERWPAAQRLVKGGFSPHALDSSGALPWEKMSPQPVENQVKLLDSLDLWPRTSAELEAGWARRGLASGYMRSLDMGLRAHMGQRLPDGEDFHRSSIIEGLLRLRRTSGYDNDELHIPKATMEMWNASSPQERQQSYTITSGPFPGTWSLAQAVLYVSTLAGPKALRPPAPLGTQLSTGLGGTTLLRDFNASHFAPWSKLVHALDDATLDQPLITKIVAGRKMSLTARGMWALAHLEWSCRPRQRAKDAVVQEGFFPPVTEAWAREALTALYVFSSLRPKHRLDDLNDLFTGIHGFRPDVLFDPGLNTLPPAEVRDREAARAWRDAITAVADPVVTLTIAHQFEATPQAMLCQIRTQLPPPFTTPTPQEQRRLPDFWAWLVDSKTYTHGVTPLRRLAPDPSSGPDPRGLLDTLAAWGQVPTAAVIEKAVALITEHVDIREAEHLQADWRAHQSQASIPAHRPKPRLRP